MAPSLGERIEDHLKRELEALFARGWPTGMPKDLLLLPVLGNGLTRLTADNQAAGSWDQWIRDAFAAVGQSEKRFDALRRRGYEYSEILDYVLSLPGKNVRARIWRALANPLRTLEPNVLHHALVLLASRVATTNYDDLVELAAFEQSRYDSRLVFVPGGRPVQARITKLPIYKLHDSMPCPAR